MVNPGKYAPVGTIKNEIISPNAPISIAGRGPNIAPAIAIGKNEPLILTAFPKTGSVVLANIPKTTRSASSIAIITSDCRFFNSLKEFFTILTGTIFPLQSKLPSKTKRRANARLKYFSKLQRDAKPTSQV